jgi:tRNA U34 5-methylaminomethyl-2-thiouridine-forming methyltransferase MnmC
MKTLSPLRSLPETQKLALLETLRRWGAHRILVPEDAVGALKACGLECSTNSDNSLSLLHTRIELVHGDWRAPGVYAPRILAALAKFEGLEFKCHRLNGRGFIHIFELEQLAEHWGLAGKFGTLRSLQILPNMTSEMPRSLATCVIGFDQTSP